MLFQWYFLQEKEKKDFSKKKREEEGSAWMNF